jgi:hypothetical protein
MNNPETLTTLGTQDTGPSSLTGKNLDESHIFTSANGYHRGVKQLINQTYFITKN